MINKKIIACDLDNTLTKDITMIQDELVNPVIRDFINNLYKDQNNIIIIYTARDIGLKTQTIEWLENNEIKYHDIIFNKLRYDILIDDKAINLTGL